MKRPVIPAEQIPRFLIVINVFVALLYFSWWLQLDNMKNPLLYGLLFLGEIYHLFMAITFWFTVRSHEQKPRNEVSPAFQPTVDVFITVAGEPVEVVEQTLLAALAQEYDSKKIYLLNDGYVAKKDNWQEIERLAERHGAFCITRREPGGAKAGNINNALRHTNGELVVILDADMVPESDFLNKVAPYFQDARVGFVQTPQFYNNQHENMTAGSAWEQQALFFGPIMNGKDSSNAAFICGTNVMIRRTALEAAGGMCEDNIAEDFLTSLRIHEMGWQSVYHNEVLCQGLAPADLLSYFKQQLRWARGSLEVLFGSNPLLKRGLSWKQKLEYLSSGMYYLNGVIVAIDILIPLIFLYFGLEPVSATTTDFAMLFIPFILVNLMTLYIVSGHSLSWRALAFSQSSWTIQLIALQSVLRGENMSFSVTPKQAQQGNYLGLAAPHLLYVGLSVVGALVGIARDGFSPAVVTNISWVIFNSLMFLPFIQAAYDWSRWREWFQLPNFRWTASYSSGKNDL